MSRMSKSNEGKSKTRNIIITVALPIMTAIILGIVDRVLFFRKLKSLSSSLQEDQQSLLEKQNLQTQEDLRLLAEKQDQQITVLHTLEEESNHNPIETEPDANWHRLILFSDAVFAIAITLLVLDIHTPTGSYYFLYNLTRLSKNILIFAYTFLFIGFFWNLHRQVFSFIKRIDTRLVILNFLVLLLIVFMPFTTSLLYENGETSPEAVYSNAQVVGRVYASSLVILGIMFGLLWFYASRRRRLLEEHVDARTIRHYYWAISLPTIVYLVTLFFTFIGANYSRPPINLGIYYYYITGVDLSQFIWLILPIGLLG